MHSFERHVAVLSADLAGLRLDQALARAFPDYSRSMLKAWILAGQVRVDGSAARPRDRVVGGEAIELDVPRMPAGEWLAEPIPLTVLYEDAEILVIAKPAGLVVHPGAGNPSGTLLNALLHRAPELRELPRAGIVHRLDKDTSGLLVVARTSGARARLVAQLQARSVERRYRAIVLGRLIGGGRIEMPIGRHPVERVRMGVVARGKAAVTHYSVRARFRGHTEIEARLETGRTHQIRVHLAHLGYPLIGDPTYGGRLRIPPGMSEPAETVLRSFRRQALHAETLALDHPASGDRMQWTTPPPADYLALRSALLADADPAKHASDVATG